MNIISQFNKILEDNFNKFLKNYFNSNLYLFKSSNFNNYYDFINNLDSFSNSITQNILISYFDYIDECFFNSSYRRNFCKSKGFYERKNFVTLFGNVSFKRRYYFDKLTKEYFFFVDLFLGLPERKHFDPFVCSEIVDLSASYSYSKSGIITANKIGSRINNDIYISRATARNIVMSFNPYIDEEKEIKRMEKLFIMLDEKFVGSQFNNGKDHMIKAAVIYENTKLEYKTKRKENSTNRYRLVNPHTCASTSDNLINDVVNYIYNNYDTDYLQKIYFMGDCAKWIKEFPKSSWFKFNPNIKINFSMDGFHFSQALQLLTTKSNKEWNVALEYAVKNNDKNLFRVLCNNFIELNKDRKDTIESKMNYILNNWKERQSYQNKPFLKCSMESHISHIFADIFTSRPKAYSKKGIDKLLEIRLLKINGYNLKEIYFKSLNNKKTTINNNLYIKRKDLNLDYYSNDKYDLVYHLPFKLLQY